MSFEKTKILASFAVIGFFIGVTAYFIFDWLFTNQIVGISLAFLLSPIFISGVAGAVLSTIIVVVFARFTRRR